MAWLPLLYTVYPTSSVSPWCLHTAHPASSVSGWQSHLLSSVLSLSRRPLPSQLLAIQHFYYTNHSNKSSQCTDIPQHCSSLVQNHTSPLSPLGVQYGVDSWMLSQWTSLQVVNQIYDFDPVITSNAKLWFQTTHLHFILTAVPPKKTLNTTHNCNPQSWVAPSFHCLEEWTNLPPCCSWNNMSHVPFSSCIFYGFPSIQKKKIQSISKTPSCLWL